MSVCTQTPSCPPPLNSDVGGIGVRISFYLQSIFLACLAARSEDLDKIKSALYTLIATNIAMAVTTAILSFKTNPEVTLQDTIVVLYLLSSSWIAVFFSLPSYNSFLASDRILKYFSILQSYAIFALAYAVLLKADADFGSQPDCNYLAKVTIFRAFSILPVGRILAIVLLSLVTVLYTISTVNDYIPMHFCSSKRNGSKIGQMLQRSSTQPDGPQGDHSSGIATPHVAQAQPSSQTRRAGEHEKTENVKRRRERFDAGFDGPVIVAILVILVVWTISVLNTELLIKQNKFQPTDESQWQFGQILTLFLVVLPCTNVIQVFREKGLWKVEQYDIPARQDSAPGLDTHHVDIMTTRGSIHSVP